VASGFETELGESFVGDGVNAAHINTVLGRKAARSKRRGPRRSLNRDRVTPRLSPSFVPVCRSNRSRSS
jgi:hypothetical protein